MIPSEIKALILDMDGVIWKADAPIGDLPGIFGEIRKRGLRFVFATNNGTKTPEEYRHKLSRLGVQVDNSQIVTSALAVAQLLARHHARGARIFMIGGAGVRQALEHNGFELLPLEKASQAEAVVMGIDRSINFEKINEATLLVRSGVPFYATNTDRTFPTPRGEIPGAGSWLSVITTATGVKPIAAGKPQGLMMELSLELLGTQRKQTLIVGDRLETDIAAGQAVGCPTAAVLSGVSTRPEAEAWQPAPDIIAESLSALLQYGT